MRRNRSAWSIGVCLFLLVGCARPAKPPTPTFEPTATEKIVAAVTLAIAAPSNTPHPSPTHTVAPTSTRTPEPPPALIPRMTIGEAITFSKIDMITRWNGWGLGGKGDPKRADHVFRTSDGGETWIDVTPPEYANPASGSPKVALAAYENALVGWVAYASDGGVPIPSAPVVWGTADGGLTWTSGAPLGIPAGAGKFSVTDFVFNSRFGWLLAHTGGGTEEDQVALFLSTDLGATWSQALQPSADAEFKSCAKTGMWFADSIHGWITGDCGKKTAAPFVLGSYDGGATWQRIGLPPPPDKSDLFGVARYACATNQPLAANGTANVLAGFSVDCQPVGGTTGDALHYFYYTMDWGKSWTIRSYPGGRLFFLDSAGWAFGKDIYFTKNTAASWAIAGSVFWEGPYDFINATEGWAVGTQNGDTKLYKTTDGGLSWAAMNPVVK
jgi:hypothetical protein